MGVTASVIAAVTATVAATAVGTGELAKHLQDNTTDDCSVNVTKNKWADGVGGAMSGILRITGLGSLVDPLTPLQSKLSTDKATLQSIYNRDGLLAAQNTAKIEAELMAVMQQQDPILKAAMELNTELIDENISRLDVAAMAIGVLVLIIAIYLISIPA